MQTLKAILSDNKWYVIVAAVFLIQAIGLCLPHGAAAAGSAPADVVLELMNTVKSIKTADEEKSVVLTADDERRNRELISKVNSMIDIEGISAYALSDHWKRRGAGDRREFVNLFTTLLEKVAYTSTSDFIKDLDLTVRKEKIVKGKAMVYTSVVHHKEGRVDIDFKLHQKGSGWTIEDVYLDGVSLARNLRTQCQKTIRDNSFSGLLQRMRDKIRKHDEEDISIITGRS